MKDEIFSLLNIILMNIIPLKSIETRMNISIAISRLITSDNIYSFITKYFAKMLIIKRLSTKCIYIQHKSFYYEDLENFVKNNYADHVISYKTEHVVAMKDIQHKFVGKSGIHNINILLINNNDVAKEMLTLKNIMYKIYSTNIEICNEFINNITSKNINNINKEIKNINIYTDKNNVWTKTNIMYTNRNINNVILSDEVYDNFYNDIVKFLHNKEFYDKYGIPYKRGYMLYGPPGTGKTSAIKAVASTLKLSIIDIKLNNIKSNKDLDIINNHMAYYMGKEPYIVILEDMDRYNFVNNKYMQNVSSDSDSDTDTDTDSDICGKNKNKGSTNSNNKCNVSIDAILNFIDGINEPNNRIIIATTNDINKILAIEGLTRPGRFDKIINFDYCNCSHIIKLLNLYYEGHNISKDDILPNVRITPAQICQYMINGVSADCILEKINSFVYHDESNSCLKLSCANSDLCL